MISLHARHLRHELHDGKNSRILVDVPELVLEPGSSLAITGPSGSGKTTLLHILAGLLPPTTGTILWGDTDMYHIKQSRRDALRASLSGMIFQDFQLLAGLSALDNVLLPRTFHNWHVTQDERDKAEQLLAQLGISHPGTRAERLSRGEMQRVALARAFSGQCQLLFADEPTASLDADNATRVIESLEDIRHTRGASLVCVTHDSRLMDRMDHCLRLEHDSEAVFVR